MDVRRGGGKSRGREKEREREGKLKGGKEEAKRSWGKKYAELEKSVFSSDLLFFFSCPPLPPVRPRAGFQIWHLFKIWIATLGDVSLLGEREPSHDKHTRPPPPEPPKKKKKNV